jgi:hypothetical protein
MGQAIVDSPARTGEEPWSSPPDGDVDAVMNAIGATA